MTIVSIEQMQDQLNLPISQDEYLIEQKIGAAEAWIAAYIGADLIEKYETPDAVPATVVEAIKQLAGHFYEQREGSPTIPNGVTDLLRSERVWCF
ncbi:secreted protein with Ig-like and vWFA domain [Rhodoligotrophos appendicifer]|uniref:head-tail connector protein n=1 Tax=Rhodoligotrophos appendicifer TaxID=987056 RepID=UPI0011854F01|nr:head-tail connector protein [Rhodoligotrophos appendicifer]